MTQHPDRDQAKTTDTSNPGRRPGRRRIWLFGLGSLILAAIGWGTRPPVGELRATIVRDSDSDSVAFSPDGRFLVAGGQGITIGPVPRPGEPFRGRILPGSDELLPERLGAKQAGRTAPWPPRTLPPAISPDGTTVVASNLGEGCQFPVGELKLRAWDAATGDLKATLSIPFGDFRGLGVSDHFAFADGGRILQAIVRIRDDEYRVLRWDARNWRPVPGITFRNARAPTLDPQVEHDRILALGWQPPVWGPLPDVDLKVGRIRSAEFGRDGTTMTLTSDDRSAVAVHDLPSGREQAVLRQPGGASGPLEFRQSILAPDGRSLVAECMDDSFQIWDVPTATIRAELPPATTGPRFAWSPQIRLSPDGRTAAISRGNSSVVLWDIATAKVRATIPGYEEGLPPRIAFSSDGRMLALADTDAGVSDPFLRIRLKAMPYLARVGLLAPTKGRWGSHPVPGRLRLYEVATGRHVLHFVGPQDYVQQIAFAPDGRMLATTGFRYSNRRDRSMLRQMATMLWDIPPGR